MKSSSVQAGIVIFFLLVIAFAFVAVTKPAGMLTSPSSTTVRYSSSTVSSQPYVTTTIIVTTTIKATTTTIPCCYEAESYCASQRVKITRVVCKLPDGTTSIGTQTAKNCDPNYCCEIVKNPPPKLYMCGTLIATNPRSADCTWPGFDAWRACVNFQSTTTSTTGTDPTTTTTLADACYEAERYCSSAVLKIMGMPTPLQMEVVVQTLCCTQPDGTVSCLKKDFADYCYPVRTKCCEKNLVPPYTRTLANGKVITISKTATCERPDYPDALCSNKFAV